MKKANILILSGISAIILFIILTVVQAKLIKTETEQTVFVSNADVLRDSELTEGMYRMVNVPVTIVKNTDAITNINEIKGKYAKETINKGQILFRQDLASKEELKIINVDSGLERIAIKLKASDNAVAYQVKPKDRVHLYFTGKSNVINNIVFENESEKNNNVIQTLKLIEDTEILGVYDETGRSYDSEGFNKLDTIVIAVSPKDAKIINNLRSQGTFDITR